MLNLLSPERARQIWANRSPFGNLECSEFERQQIKLIWNAMPGNTCFADALLRIANGKTHDMEIFLMSDQPTTCPSCGSRTEFDQDHSGRQLHTCLNASCRYSFLVDQDDDSN